MKTQVTIPKRVRDALGLQPGDLVEFAIGPDGRVRVLRGGSAPAAGQDREPDGIDRARGSVDFKWGSTAEYMKFIRGDDYEIEMD